MAHSRIEMLDPLTDGRWDELVIRHPEGWIYHLAAWKRIIEESFPHIKGRYMAAVDPETGRVSGGLPLCTVKSWLTGKRMVSLPFSTLCTPLAETDVDLSLLLQAAAEECLKSGSDRLEIRSMRSLGGLAPSSFVERGNYRLHEVDLTPPLESISGRFDRSCVRQRISRAGARGVVVRDGETESDLRRFYSMYVMTRKRVRRPCQPFSFFQHIWKGLHPSGMCGLRLAFLGGQPAAGLIILKYKQRASVEWAASDERFKDFSPNQLLFWETIKAVKAEGFTRFDFGRTEASNAGLMDFKKRWGSVETVLYEYINPPQAVNGPVDGSRGRSLAMKICGSAPRVLSGALGAFFYRHLG